METGTSWTSLLDSVDMKAAMLNRYTETLLATVFYFLLVALLCRLTINYKAHSSRHKFSTAKIELASANMQLPTARTADGAYQLVRQARGRLNEVREKADQLKTEEVQFALEQIEEAHEWACNCNTEVHTVVTEHQIIQIKSSVRCGEKERRRRFWESLEAMSLYDICLEILEGLLPSKVKVK